MSTSDQHSDQPLTRKQLREMRLTGATPVISEEAAAAAAENARPVAPVEVPPAPVDADQVDLEAAPLTRRQARVQERILTASVPVIETPEQPEAGEQDEDDDEIELVSEIPAFQPVSAKPMDAPVDEPVAVEEDEENEAPEPDEAAESDELPVADAVVTGERPVVSPTFGNDVLDEKTGKDDVPSFSPSFDELITSDSAGSNRASNTLIFTHPGESTLSGPVAATGELLITGSYELPKGLGSQGHAHGAADGKDADAALFDTELAPASSPTPIAASSAISTLKPAGEVIRPPAPEKGNKLMLTLAITAGGLALALAVALIVAFTTNVLG